MVIIDKFRYEVSSRADKKLQVLVNGKWIHFGQKGYQHYFDRTKLLPKSWNHNDGDRRRRYLARASKITTKKGTLAAKDINSANYHAIKVLW